MSSALKTSGAIMLFLAILMGYAYYATLETNTDRKLHFEIIRVNDGFGYKILSGEKILILQEFVPGLAGKRTFDTESQALAVGNLVIWKLENGKSPILKPSDLMVLNIPLIVP